MYRTNHDAIRSTTAMTMNQLNSNPPIYLRKAFFGWMYWIELETLSGLIAVFIALTNTVAAAVASRFIAVPISVWSALKLMQATASRQE